MSANEKDYKEKLIAAVKKEVKQVMEESVTRKFVHEESGSVTSLCAAVEACLSQGLRRRALGLFKTSSTTALLHKIAKHSSEAANISKKVQELENVDPNRRSSSSSDSLTKPTLKKNASLPNCAPLPKYLWIRLALFEKQLAKIIDYLVSNAGKYYDKDALVADPDYGSILSSLLVGPCALDYSRTKSHDHFWTDPPADELVQRHRISSGHSTPPSVRRPILNFRRSLNTSSEDTMSSRSSTQHIAKDYVESLHQNSRATLLFGKNNVLVLPVNAEVSEPMPGYLSLHQTAHGLTIKWTPNQLMNGFIEESQDKSIYWDYALQVRLDEVVYVHCHQDSEAGGTVILVGQDGVQRPPIHFPKGGHMLAFLSCIETGLLPRGRLDPPLWSHRSGKNCTRRRRPLPALSETEETTKDYVFRIIDNSDRKEILKRNELMDTHAALPTKVRVQLCSTSTSSDSSTKSFSIDQNVPDSPPSVCIKAVCDSMKRQIISRAFYGWLAYCRHLSTVRTHLSGLVNGKIVSGEGASEGITIERWAELCVEGVVSDYSEVYRLTYFGGIVQELRHEIWPYLLGHYKFGSTQEQRNELSEETKQAYENTMSEWLAVEAIVRQRDKENQAHAIAKLSSESMSGDQLPPQIQRELSNEVFEDDGVTDDEGDESLEDDKAEQRGPRPKRTKQNTIKYESDEDGEGRGVGGAVVGAKPENVQNEEALSCRNSRHSSETSDTNVGKLGNACKLDIDEVASKLLISGEEAVDRKDEDDIHLDPHVELKDFIHNVIVTNASVDMSGLGNESLRITNLDAVTEENNSSLDTCIETHGLASPARSACVSPASSNGGIYSQELLETFGLNLHRIEKDVQRCDRNYWFFMEKENLDKLRNVMCTYVWEHLDIGYMQGMCDLVAPLLVIFNDESLTYACFCHLMERMVENFPNGTAMDCHFANMRSLIQILDSEMYELMHAHGDYTHFYFCYRWFLLDFKRELVYPDVNATWEVIWAAQQVASSHFVLFLALALLETYRDIILSNGMDFTDIIKFFNEMAEHHDAAAILKLARELVLQLQLLIENK
ncbi:small G protein signaling modulator 2-like [Anoplophora glabripennis]|uniref:small G protein signaling modulator 2-like n=1 Tax=Anoplophora glabripennis TaxID=217634 RepID=UPI000C76CCA3|nr:small G protein signaling modulator 2-like [Anoplophora glabripennis]